MDTHRYPPTRRLQPCDPSQAEGCRFARDNYCVKVNAWFELNGQELRCRSRQPHVPAGLRMALTQAAGAAREAWEKGEV